MGLFRERALAEARRYGADPWVFVRELLQNARDAGARRVVFTVGEHQGRTAVECRDDGEGMTFAHAERFLFRLYASSKEGRGGRAGRFGVGFWSVLRFEPSRIVVRSWPRRGAPWELELDGALASAERRAPGAAGCGTEVLLERPQGEVDVAAQVIDAARRCGRFLTCVDAPSRALEVSVNGQALQAPFELGAPSARFVRRGLRGVVGLGQQPRVELFAQGLFVRAASSLRELLAPDEQDASGSARPQPPAAARLAPVALLDGRELELLMSRDDPRHAPALSRLVATAQGELDRLIERQLDSLRPRPAWRRGLDLLREHAGAATAVAAAALASAGAALALASWVPAPRGLAAEGVVVVRSPSPDAPRTALAAAAPALVAYRDLGTRYDGPSTGGDDVRAQVALTYRPAHERPYLAALLLDEPESAPSAARAASAYLGAPCARECLDIALDLTGAQGPTRLPVPSGHAIDPRTLLVDGHAAALHASPSGEPVVDLPADARLVRYRTAPAKPIAERARMPDRSRWPADMEASARHLARLPEAERVAYAVTWVRDRIAYSTRVEAKAGFRRWNGGGFVPAALAAGAGDCDVINGVLALLLRAAGTPARLAIGYVGDEGRALPGLHAWVEYRDSSGFLHVADATVAEVAPSSAPLPDPVSARAEPGTGAALVAAERSASRVLAWAGRAVGAALGAAALALFGVGLVVFARRTRREVALDPGRGIAELLQGVLTDPEAFAHLPAVLNRPLLPCQDGTLLSLGDAWERATRGRLFASRARSPLARRAWRGGAAVLDANQAEARVVAEALGALDLDAWNDRLAACRSSPLLEALDRDLRCAGQTWRVRACAGSAEPSLLDLDGVPIFERDDASRVVVASDAWLTAGGRATARPAEAVFELADRVARFLALDDVARLRLLGPLARRALEEVAK